MYTRYLTVHDEHHGFPIERIPGDKFLFNWIRVLKMHLDKLPVDISSIKYTVVDARACQIKIIN